MSFFLPSSSHIEQFLCIRPILDLLYIFYFKFDEHRYISLSILKQRIFHSKLLYDVVSMHNIACYTL